MEMEQNSWNRGTSGCRNAIDRKSRASTGSLPPAPVGFTRGCRVRVFTTRSTFAPPASVGGDGLQLRRRVATRGAIPAKAAPRHRRHGVGLARIRRATRPAGGCRAPLGHPRRRESYPTRFRREARLAASLTHPNLVGIYDFGGEGERPYLVMEHVEGETLAGRIADATSRARANSSALIKRWR
jgi:serine/threonine protein kinase